MSKKIENFFLKLSFFLIPLSVGFITISLTLITLLNIPFSIYFVIGVSLFFGIVFWFAALYFKNLYRFYFVSTFLLQVAGLLSIYEFGFVPYSFKKLWPIFMIFISVSFTVAGLARYRTLKPSFVVLSSAFMFLGVLFLLFSTEIIQISFISFALITIPLFLVPGILTFVFWLYRKRKPSRQKHE